MNKSNKFLALFLALGFALFIATPAFAGQPHDWQLGLQEPASPVKEQIDTFHNYLLIMVFGVSIFVLGLLFYVCWRFSEKRNKTPSTTTHHVKLEIIWTAIPVFIIVLILIPSIRLLYFEDKIENPELTIKVVGHQWYWEYLYPDNGDIRFDSYMIKDEDLKPGQLRLLEVDKRVVLPVDTNIRILITAADVLHAWAVPAFGVKKDAVPGLLQETWVNITKPGVYYGQCSELCGVYHGFMPIVVEAVSKEEFKKWVEQSKGKLTDSNTLKIASN